MTQEIKANGKISQTLATKIWVAVAIFVLTGWIAWVSSQIVELKVYMAGQTSMDVRVLELEKFALKGGRYTKEDGDALESQIQAHISDPGHTVMVERVDTVKLQMAAIMETLKRIEVKLDKLRR